MLPGMFPVYIVLSAALAQSVFTFQEVMIPVRDGVKLQTVILAPAGQTKPLPILLRRTPYGLPKEAPAELPVNLKELNTDGYIFVIQNLRGRFLSEGVFKLSSQVNLQDPKDTNETTDAYDTIDWLVKNVAKNNGRVGIFGVSYDGLTAGLTLLQPHPALKAVSEQAAPADQWMNDDDHRYGALRLSYSFEYAVMEQASKTENTHFQFDIFDAYEWYLKLGPIANINNRYLHNTIPMWNETVEHPDYDAFWKREAWVRQIHDSAVPNLNVAGFWDQEDPWGPWQIFRAAEKFDSARQNFMVAGPWFHGEWHSAKGERIGDIPFGGHETAREFRERIEAPFFKHYLHGEGEKFTWKASTFQSGSNTWRTYSEWPPKGAKATNLYFHADGTLSFEENKSGGSVAYVSDPANPVPYRQRPISPTYPGGDWRTWEVADQRFVDHRPDVLSFVGKPLEKDLVVSGPVSAELFASTTGTDGDFVVKLIDLYPEDGASDTWKAETGPGPGEYAHSLNGYELPVAMEVRRGRYNKSYEHAAALVPGQATQFSIPLRDRDHVFLKGHRLMVQVQSTWFPLIDRNPQKFVPSIYTAKEGDFVKATQKVYCGQGGASRIVLPVVGR